MEKVRKNLQRALAAIQLAKNEIERRQILRKPVADPDSLSLNLAISEETVAMASLLHK